MFSIDASRRAAAAVRLTAMAVISIAGTVGFTAGCAGPLLERSTVDAELAIRLDDLEHRTQDVDAALARGETVALVFWQPACRTCAREAPELNRAVAMYGGDIRFLGVIPGARSLDDGALLDAAASFGYRFPQARDVDESLCRALGVTATPTLIVIGAGREIRYRGHRLPEDWRILTSDLGPSTAAARLAAEIH